MANNKWGYGLGKINHFGVLTDKVYPRKFAPNA